MENNKKRLEGREIILIVCTILVIILVVFVFTYSFNREEFINNFFADVIEVDEDAYGVNSFDSSNLNLRPILDSELLLDENKDNIIKIDFVVGGGKDNTVSDAVYNISLVDLGLDCELLSSYVKWRLYKNKELLSSGSFDYRFDTIADNRLVLTDSVQALVPYSDNKDSYDKYSFYLYISDSCQEEDISLCKDNEEQSYLMNRKLSGKIQVEVYKEMNEMLVRHPSEELDINTCINE